MPIRTITRADLSEAVYRQIGLSRTESGELVEMVLREMTLALARGEHVKLSSFGSFVVRKKRERIGRNPRTGVEVPIKPRRVLLFKPSNILKSRINGSRLRITASRPDEQERQSQPHGRQNRESAEAAARSDP